MKQSKYSMYYGFAIISIALFMLSALFFMVLWNGSVSQVTSLPTLSYWTAVKSWLFICVTVGLVRLAKAITSFIVLNISIAVTKRKLNKVKEQAMQSQEELLKHFSMFNNPEDKEKKNE